MSIANSVAELLSREDEDFVRCAYLTFFRRPPDPAGLGNYLGRLRAGESKLQIARELRLSPEGITRPILLPDLGLLFDPLDVHERLHAVTAVGSADAGLVSTLEQLLALPDRAFVIACYWILLRRAEDLGGVETYLQLLRSGTSKIRLFEVLRSCDEGQAVEAVLKQWQDAVEAKSSERASEQSTHSLALTGSPKSSSIRTGLAASCAVPAIKELLSESDKTFVTTIYRVLLARAPKPEEALRQGTMLGDHIPRHQILVEVWHSEEGRKLRALLQEINRVIKKYQSAKLPLVGWIATKWHGVEGERAHERRARRIESQLAMLSSRNDEHYRDMLIASPTRGGLGAGINLTTQADAIFDSGTHSIRGAIATSEPSRLLLEVDLPNIREGVAVDPVHGPMSIVGWALARGGIARVDVTLNGTPLGSAHYGIARPDVSAAHPTLASTNQCGYVFHLPILALPDGFHFIALTARSNAGEESTLTFRISVANGQDPESIGSIRRRISQVERDTLAGVLSDLDWEPSFRLIVVGGGGGADQRAWRLTLRSLLGQSWDHWHATILVASPNEAQVVQEMVAQLRGGKTERFRYLDLSDAAMIDAPLHDGGDDALVGILFSGDELGLDALGAFAVASGLHRQADVFYADEFRAMPGSDRPQPFYKPDYSPSLLLSTNYAGRPIVVRPAVLAAVGASVGDITRSGLFDLLLRCVDLAKGVHHLRELVSRTDSGVSGCTSDDAAAIARAMARRGVSAEVSAGAVPDTWRIRRRLPLAAKVSIIIPTCAANGHIETCLKSLREGTAHRDFEVICVENIPDSDSYHKRLVRDQADRVLTMAQPFNWSRFNNLAAEVAKGGFLLFLNDDIEVIEPEWLAAMLEDAVRPEVGIVGARLLYPNRTVQHAGMFLGENGVGRHAFRHADENDPGYFGLALTRREVIAVTGACMMVRREVFDRLGRFDEAHDVINNDLDFCLRVHRAGLLTVYTPYATLIHHERASREAFAESFDATAFHDKWNSLFAAGDPYYNPHLSRRSEDYRIDDEGVAVVFAGQTLMRRADVKEILAVKLDHIGDFVTALPAMRRLKQLFPTARLTLLGAPATIAFAQGDPLFDECIAFEFFHAQSQLGELKVDSEADAALTRQLASRGFDLAVDFRKHLATRHILQYSGARILAGYDSFGRCPWLDIAPEYAGDEALARKRNHITDDLLNLVAAIDTAFRDARSPLEPIPTPMLACEIPEHARHLFILPVVAVHPGAGNVIKQWPEAHFLSLIDLLIERNGVAVVLVGSTSEKALSQSLVDRTAYSDRIASVAGEIALHDLPRFLANCTLFVGNDSGPKHIAAAVGVPTIGIHSGVVSPVEWAPLGKRAVALHRNMTCSPCYLANARDCPREIACIRLLEPALVHQMAEKFLARPLVQASGPKSQAGF